MQQCVHVLGARHWRSRITAAVIALVAWGGAAAQGAAPFSAAARAEALRVDREQAVARAAAFRAEQTDSEWAAAAAPALRKAIAHPQAGSLQVRRLECRATTCRAEVLAGAGVALNEVLPRLLMLLEGQHVSGMVMDPPMGDPADTARVLYFSR
jgi:hypothetical protein